MKHNEGEMDGRKWKRNGGMNKGGKWANYGGRDCRNKNGRTELNFMADGTYSIEFASSDDVDC